MSEEELQQIIEKKKNELNELQKNSKAKEKELKEEKESLEKQKAHLLRGIQSRIQLIDMLKRDTVRMAYEEFNKISQQDFEKSNSSSSSNSLPQLQHK